MYGSLIGLIPKSFVIVLIENHQWYELKKASDGMNLSDKYQTIQTRQLNTNDLEKKPFEMDLSIDYENTMMMSSNKMTTEKDRDDTVLFQNVLDQSRHSINSVHVVDVEKATQKNNNIPSKVNVS